MIALGSNSTSIQKRIQIQRCDASMHSLFFGMAQVCCLIMMATIKYKINLTMEEEQVEWPVGNILKYIVNSSQLNLMQTLLSFLSKEQIAAIASPLSNHSQFFFKMATAQNFLNQYINRVDRTNYYLFYDEPDFKRIEQQHLLFLVHQHYQALALHHKAFGQLKAQLSKETMGLEGREELNGIFLSIFFETDLALPRMKRETIGMFCQSGVQEWLALLRFPEQQMEPWTEQCILQLKSQVQSDYQDLIAHFPYNHSPLQHPASTTHEKVRIVRYTGYKVTHDNWKDFLIEGFRLHNLIVVLLGLSSQLVTSYAFILNYIQDPFMRFTEFTLRANIFRNLILNLQQKFAFVFNAYSQFYDNVYSPPNDRPPFRYHRPALSMWLQEMRVFHQGNQRVYNYVGAKMQEESLLVFLQAKTEKLPSFFSTLKEQVSMRVFSEQRRQEVYVENNNKVELEGFFEGNPDLYQTLTKDYLEYMVDITIDEVTVHTCGHSLHSIANHPLFRQFAESVTSQTMHLYKLIQEVLLISSPPELRLGFYREVVKEDLAFLGSKLVKPVTLREIVKLVNDGILNEVEKMPQYCVFGEQGMTKYRINWQFEQKDTLLDYFCTKYNVVAYPPKLQFYYQPQIQNLSETGSEADEDSFEYCDQYNSEGEVEY